MCSRATRCVSGTARAHDRTPGPAGQERPVRADQLVRTTAAARHCLGTAPPVPRHRLCTPTMPMGLVPLLVAAPSATESVGAAQYILPSFEWSLLVPTYPIESVRVAGSRWMMSRSARPTNSSTTWLPGRAISMTESSSRCSLEWHSAYAEVVPWEVGARPLLRVTDGSELTMASSGASQYLWERLSAAGDSRAAVFAEARHATL